LRKSPIAFSLSTRRQRGSPARWRSQGHAPGFADIIVAATAQHHRLTILSRNLRHLAPLGVGVIDPFTTLPPV
jgi:predicted nucleic acid-binding protein